MLNLDIYSRHFHSWPERLQWHLPFLPIDVTGSKRLDISVTISSLRDHNLSSSLRTKEELFARYGLSRQADKRFLPGSGLFVIATSRVFGLFMNEAVVIT